MANENKGGIGCGAMTCILLGVAFIVLRLCNVIAWSWWWVLAPFWVPAIIVALCALIIGLANAIE